MAYLIVLILYSIVFGFVTKYVAESKGYDGGFWWGFWLGIIGLLVVGFRPDNRQEYRPSSSAELPAWASSSSSSSSSSSGWTCLCGAKNPSSIDYCLSCRRSKSDAVTPKKICPHCGAGNRSTNTLCFACDKPLDESEANKPATPAAELAASAAAAVDYVALLEQLAKLHDQNILTDEEFQQKKAKILAKM